MGYQVVLTSKMAAALKEHLLADSVNEQMAVMLSGINRLKGEVSFLGRHLILLPPEAFKVQSSCYLEVKPEIQRFILELAASEGLSQIDWHKHPGESSQVGFSGVDDLHEARLASYLEKKIPGTFYGSVVVNRHAHSSRIWERKGGRLIPTPLDNIRIADYEIPGFPPGGSKETNIPLNECFSRQVLAFGEKFQRKLSGLKVGLIGHGGLGSIVAKQLARLGVIHWVVADVEYIEDSNRNRLPGSLLSDCGRRMRKVALAKRNIFRINPKARIIALALPVGDQRALAHLKTCDLLILGTDNHSSRFIANHLSSQYLIPLIHLGVNIDIDENRKITDISGEYALPSLGEWCLQCSGIIDPQLAGWELADEETKKAIRARGYIKDTPAPAVYHLNGVIASLAVAEVHNFVFPYKPIRRYLAYDELKGQLLSLSVPSRGDCPVCSPDGGILGLGDLLPLPDYCAKKNRIPSPEQIDRRLRQDIEVQCLDGGEA